MSKWPKPEFFYNSIDEYDGGIDMDIHCEYLLNAEDKVNKEFKIFPEPSLQGGQGGMFLFDESGNGYESVCVDWSMWCEVQLERATTAKSEAEYEELYRNYISGLLKDRELEL